MFRSLYLKFSLLLCVILLTQITANAQDYKQRLDSLFNSLNQDHEFSAAVLISDKGKLSYERYFGYEDVTTQTPIDANSRFELASVSKQFTAMAIMQLVNQGKLSYEDKLQKFFPELPFKEVTVEQMLRHTSGIPEFLGYKATWFDQTKVNTNKDLMRVMQAHIDSTAFPPGTAFAYSNSNYILLAEIVEKVSKLPFPEYMNRYVFKPAGMKSTSVFSYMTQKKPVKHYAAGHSYDGKAKKFQKIRTIESNHFVDYFDGISGPYGISSTARDLFLWDQALNQEKLLPKNAFQKALTVGKLNDGNNITGSFGAFAGYGWLFMEAADQPKMHFHTGGWPGYQTIIVRDPEDQKLVVILLNKSGLINIYALMSGINAILGNAEVPPIEREKFSEYVFLMEFQVNELLGTYEFTQDSNLKYSITANDDGAIFAQLSNQPSVEVFPLSPTELTYQGIQATIKFQSEKDKVTQLTLFQNGMELVFKKVN